MNARHQGVEAQVKLEAIDEHGRIDVRAGDAPPSRQTFDIPLHDRWQQAAARPDAAPRLCGHAVQEDASASHEPRRLDNPDRAHLLVDQLVQVVGVLRLLVRHHKAGRHEAVRIFVRLARSVVAEPKLRLIRERP
eukprot:7175602-Prymnesium_polylepis.1